MVGRTISHYKILSGLGQRGMGVFLTEIMRLARDPGTNMLRAGDGCRTQDLCSAWTSPNNLDHLQLDPILDTTPLRSSFPRTGVEGLICSRSSGAQSASGDDLFGAVSHGLS